MKSSKKPIIAIAFFNDKKIKGTVHFIEDLAKNDIIIDINLSGLSKNAKHGFHVHEAGDLSDNCTSACAHFNPFGKKHGGPHSKERHVGDLGNLITDANGVAKYQIRDNIITLRNKANIIGRTLVIHEDADDLGLGGEKDSLITGHSGKRIACAIIGYSKKMFV
jgi:Cu-Zn family superoxide dismutase